MLKRIQMPMIAGRCNATGIMDTVLQTVVDQERACGLFVVKTVCLSVGSQLPPRTLNISNRIESNQQQR